MNNVTEKTTSEYLERKRRERNQALRDRLLNPRSQEEMLACLSRIENLFGERDEHCAQAV